MSLESKNFLIDLSYLLCSTGFFISLKLLSSPKNAKMGNAIGAMSMFFAVMICFYQQNLSNLYYPIFFIILGSLVGFLFAGKVKMTAMPQMVAIFNGLGGLASVLVSLGETLKLTQSEISLSLVFLVTSWLSVVVGAITFTGSIIAFFKLQEILFNKPLKFIGQRVLIVFLGVLSLLLFYPLLTGADLFAWFCILAVLTAVLGVFLVAPIGGADMPVVISLLNSYSGVAALAAGFVVKNNLLIISGSLVGASGIILTRLMCQAMNRPLSNVIFGSFGAHADTSLALEKPYKEILPIDAAMMLNNASKVVVVPGYGLAVSQAQRNLGELAEILKKNSISVKYAIHPVAGRMPGHMNVLLAEADISYEDLLDLEESNAEFEDTDVVMIIGANDVINPSAKDDKQSPLYGMPILEGYKAKSIIVFKRGKGKGFAGVENPLFTDDKSSVIFGDAKASLVKVLSALKDI